MNKTDQLRALAAAELFTPFTIEMQSGDRFLVTAKEDISFTKHGSPEIRATIKRSYILNADAIVSITS